jgi:phosphorylcholine metabolism protein LicD
LEKNNLVYFASFGTLLGAVRHKGLIPWDTDTDIIIPFNEKEYYVNILQKELGDKYFIHETKEKNVIGNIIRIYLSKINTLHIDLFTYIENKDKIVFGYNRKFNLEDIFPLQKIPFYDYEIFAPKNIEKQLMTFYGIDYMKYAYKQWALDKTKFKIENFDPAKIEI